MSPIWRPRYWYYSWFSRATRRRRSHWGPEAETLNMEPNKTNNNVKVGNANQMVFCRHNYPDDRHHTRKKSGTNAYAEKVNYQNSIRVNHKRSVFNAKQ